MINLDSLPPSAHNLDLGPILARAEAASDAYFDHLAPRCSYTSAGDGMGCGLSSGHDGPHVMLIPRADGWRYVNEARTDIPALCAEVARLRAALSWQESRHGTQAEQEREEAETAAELEAIDAMSEEQVTAELREAGVDVEAGRETCEALVRVALERNRLVDVAREGRAFTAALSKLLGDAGLLEDGPIHEAHLTAVRKLIERIASLETAASAVVTEWAMIEGPDHCPHCGGEDRHNEDDDDPCPVGVLQGLLHPKARTVTPSLGIFHAPRPPGADPLPTMRLRVESQTQSLVPEAEAALSRLRAAPPVDASWAGRMADVLVAGVEGPAETGDCRTCQWACNLSSGEPGCGHPDRHKDDAWAGGNVPPTFAWSRQHLGADEMTRLPDSPPCPGYRAKES